MNKFTLLAASLLFAGTSLLAQQYPCSTFEDPNPQGNWVNDYCTATYNNNSSVDGTQCVKLGDDPGGSWFTNKVDFKWLGERFLHKCLCFDYYLVDDGDPLASNGINPTIYISDGVNSIAFVANVTVYEGVTGWVHVCAPIEFCTTAGLPSNADGTWTKPASMSCSDFNTLLMNNTTIGFPTDFTSYQTEEMWIDNVCIRDCERQDPPCTAFFDLDVKFSLSTPNAIANVSIPAPGAGSTYVVDWGDGSPLSTPGTPHTYATYGNYAVCVTEYVNNVFICKNCMNFCYEPPYSGIPGRSARNDAGEKTAFMFGKDFSNEKSEYAIFPNPSKDYATLQLSKGKGEKTTIRVIDIFGKVVSEMNVQANESRSVKINTGKLAEGIYTVEITSAGKVSTQKISVAK